MSKKSDLILPPTDIVGAGNKKGHKVKISEEIEKFRKGTSNLDEYSHLEVLGSYVLVRLFRYVPSFKRDVPTTKLWMPDGKGDYTLKDASREAITLPIVKIILNGKGLSEEDAPEVRGLYTVPVEEIMGDSWNPKFIELVGMFGNRGEGSIKKLFDMDPNIRQKIPNYEKSWSQYMFVRPWVSEPDEIDRVTYLIPVSKLKVKI